MLKVSIITVAKNAEKTIQRAIESVLAQTYKNIEYIVIDGLSTDATLKIVGRYQNRIHSIYSEADSGIYDAMNKGIKRASGDIIGILNADDFYTNNNIIEQVVGNFSEKLVDAVGGDVQYFLSNNINNVIRTYSSKYFSPRLLKFGIIPAHPALFLAKSVYSKYGIFNPKYKIAGDFDLIARIFKNGELSYKYVPQVFVKMQYGGVSTFGFKSFLTINHEIYQSCKDQQIKTNYLLLMLRYPLKVVEFFQK